MKFDYNKKSFSLLEVILAVSVFSIVVTSLISAFIYGKESTMLALNRSKATLLAEEGLEAVRNIRDENFSNLIDGTYGLSVVSNQWILSANSDTTEIFTRQIVISTTGSDTKQIIANVNWQQNLQRNGVVSLTTYLTNWAAINQIGPQADSLDVDAVNAHIGYGANTLYNISLENIGASSIIIDKMKLTWTSTRRKMEEIKLNNTIVWSMNGPGTPIEKQISGTQVDIVDFTLNGNSGVVWGNYFKFEGNVEDNEFTITFTMADKSTKVIDEIEPD